LLVLLFAAWFFRPGNRSAAVGAKSIPPSKDQHSPANREAEDFYLKGRFYWNKRTPESLNQAVDAFTQALARDPNYADAYVGLADCYNLLREFAAMPSHDAFFKAFAAAKKAVELDPQSADAHASLAFASFWGMWDARDAEKEFRRAIELEPNNAKAHHSVRYVFSWHGPMNRKFSPKSRWPANWIRALRRFSPTKANCCGERNVMTRPVQVLTQLEAAEPDFASPHRYLQFAYFDNGDYPHYVAELRQETTLNHNAAQLSEAEAAARGFAAGAERGLQQALLSQRIKLYEQGKMSPFFVAQSEARLGNSPEAIKYLTMWVQSHDGLALNVKQDNSFKSLRGNSSFEQLVSILGLPPVQ
jgi:tetratricopeptide (TPR) repeat protein